MNPEFQSRTRPAAGYAITDFPATLDRLPGPDSYFSRTIAPGAHSSAALYAFFMFSRNCFFPDDANHLIIIVIENFRTYLVAVSVPHAKIIVDSNLHVLSFA